MKEETSDELRGIADAAVVLMCRIEDASPATRRAFTMATLDSRIGRLSLLRELGQLAGLLCKALGDV